MNLQAEGGIFFLDFNLTQKACFIWESSRIFYIVAYAAGGWATLVAYTNQARDFSVIHLSIFYLYLRLP